MGGLGVLAEPKTLRIWAEFTSEKIQMPSFPREAGIQDFI